MKKAFILGSVILMFAGLFTIACKDNGGGSERDVITSNENGKEIIVGDFSLTVTLDKTEARIGDTVTATVVFKNLSGRDIEAELPDWVAADGGRNKEDILGAVFISYEDFEWAFNMIAVDQRPIILIENGAVIERKFGHVITESRDLKVHAGAFFYTATDAEDVYTFVKIVSGPIKMKVQ